MTKKQTRGLHTTTWLGDGGQRVVFVDGNYNHRVYTNVSPSSAKRVLRVMESFIDGGTFTPWATDAKRRTT